MIPRENLDAPETVPVDIEPFRVGRTFAYCGDHYRVHKFTLTEEANEPITVELQLAQTEADGPAVDLAPLKSGHKFAVSACTYDLIAVDWAYRGEILYLRLMRTWWAD